MTLIKGRKIKVTKSNENSTIFIGNIRKNWTVSDVEMKVRRIVNLISPLFYFIYYFSFRTVKKLNIFLKVQIQTEIEVFALLFLKIDMKLSKL